MSICLLMMVKNESAKIEQALTSCEELIDSYFICDTGSTDDTKDKIINFMSQRQIFGQIIDIEWRDFGYSKSIMMKEAREKAHTDYFICLDGKELVVNQTDEKPTKKDKQALLAFLATTNASIFMLKTVNKDIDYRRWNFLKNDQLYLWRSPVHEYLVPTKKDTITTNLDLLKIYVNGWGASGYSAQKYLNYAHMLETYINEHPNQTLSREIYYTAQSYRDANRMDLAIEWFKRRIAIGDFKYNEEAYISMLRLFRHYRSINDNKEAVYYLFQMAQHYPHRLEGLYEGMQYFWALEDRETAYSFAKKGMRCLKGDKKGYLFLETAIYDYLFLFNFCLVSYYNHDDHQELAEAIKLLDQEKLPENYLKLHLNNMNFYQKRLSQTKQIDSYQDLKIKNLHPNVVIVDNVLKDPDARRAFALSQPFDVTGNFPNKRTKSFATDEDKRMLEQILGAKITYWPQGYNGSYQYATSDMKSWIHRDHTEYSAILFLSKDPPITGGTETFIHKELKCTYGEAEIDKRMNQDAHNRAAWATLDSIGCLYNRLIIFNGMQSHQSRDYFGDCKENSRLFQVFFFNIERKFPLIKKP